MKTRTTFKAIYDEAASRIKSDPKLVSFASQHCKSLEQFITEVAREQYRLEQEAALHGQWLLTTEGVRHERTMLQRDQAG